MVVLIIDDEDMILTLAQKILGRAGHETMTATSGEDGLEALRRHADKIDLAIVDYSLDGPTGLDLVSAAREISPGVSLVISSGRKVESGNIPPELMRNTSILQKPYRASELIDAVEAAVESPVGTFGG